MRTTEPHWIDPDEDYIGPHGERHVYIASYRATADRVLSYLTGVMAQAQTLQLAAETNPTTTPSAPLVEMVKQIAGLALARNDVGAAADLLEVCHTLMQDEVYMQVAEAQHTGLGLVSDSD